jgi:uncharacterized protein DUF3618
VNEREELLVEIEDTRNRLGDTVEELAHRLDVKARAQDKVGAVRDSAQAGVVELGETIQHGSSLAWQQVRRIAVRRDAQLAAVGVLSLAVAVLLRRSR